MANLIFTSGQLPINPGSGKIESADAEGQAHQVFDNLESLLEDNGVAMSNVVKCTLYLRDMGDFAAINAIYETHFGGHKPARSTVQVAKLPLSAWLMVDAIAEIPAA